MDLLNQYTSTEITTSFLQYRHCPLRLILSNWEILRICWEIPKVFSHSKSRAIKLTQFSTFHTLKNINTSIIHRLRTKQHVSLAVMFCFMDLYFVFLCFCSYFICPCLLSVSMATNYIAHLYSDLLFQIGLISSHLIRPWPFNSLFVKLCVTN